MPHYDIRVPHDVTADDLFLEPGDAFRFKGLLYVVESIMPTNDRSTFTAYLKPWPSDRLVPSDVKSFP